ncbi:MAG: FeoC-like transcriptional regulator [Anaerolineales bacterium]|nr:FeoC-like transcriptional regulator [Anaerolineales bacterium]MDW8446730.1 FeoC-like transcriptional regulator [Anaerolineales bacterium]
MLERLLAELDRGQTLSVEKLALQLETTPAMVKAMLEHLERQGQVATVDFCQEMCAECPLGSICAREKRQRLWQLKLDCEAVASRPA